MGLKQAVEEVVKMAEDLQTFINTPMSNQNNTDILEDHQERCVLGEDCKHTVAQILDVRPDRDNKYDELKETPAWNEMEKRAIMNDVELAHSMGANPENYV